MALHALSKYGAATFTRTGKAIQVTIKSSGTFSTDFQVNNNNRLLLQQISLPKVPGEYSVTATGEGCVYLQVRLGAGESRESTVTILTLADVVCWIQHQLANKRLPVRFLVRTYTWVVGQATSREHVRGNHLMFLSRQCFSPSLSLALPPSLKTNK